MDPQTKENYDEIKKQILPEKELAHDELSSELGEPALPSIAPILADPQMPLPGKDKQISIAVTDDIPLKDVLIELSRLADIDMEIDPNIKGGIIFRAKNRPFYEVMDRIAYMANLRCSNKNGIVRVENDTPYLVNYELDFLNMTRSTTGTSSISSSLGGSSGGSGGASASSDIKLSYDGDLWKSVEDDINQMIGKAASGSSDSSSSSSGSSSATTSSDKSSSDTTTSQGEQSYITVNKQAGILSAMANNKQHNSIRSYLEKVRESTSAQVLIEAKIVAVTLDDQYQTGVNWNLLNSKIKGGVGLLGNFAAQPALAGVAATTNQLQLGVFESQHKTAGSVVANGSFQTQDLQSLVNLMQLFGSAKTLMSPRIHAMNNQQAVLSFVTNQVYFSIKPTYTPPTLNSTGGPSSAGVLTVTSTQNAVPIGTILMLQPSINLDTNEITMNVRPTITSISSTVTDPAVSFTLTQAGQTAAAIGNITVPIVDVKEVDSLIKIKSGQVMVIGGMMSNVETDVDSGIPGLMSLPVLGNAFKSVSKIKKVIQTVIFVKATIMPTNRASKKDRKFYNSFVSDDEVRI